MWHLYLVAWLSLLISPQNCCEIRIAPLKFTSSWPLPQPRGWVFCITFILSSKVQGAQCWWLLVFHWNELAFNIFPKGSSGISVVLARSSNLIRSLGYLPSQWWDILITKFLFYCPFLWDIQNHSTETEFPSLTIPQLLDSSCESYNGVLPTGWTRLSVVHPVI